MSTGEKRMSPAQLAPIVGVSESTLKRWIDAGLLRAERTAGGHRRVAMADIVAFLRAQNRPVPSFEALGVLAGQAVPAAEGAPTPEALAGLLLDEDITVARSVILEAFRRGRPVDEIFDRLVGPAMERVGTLWAEGAIDVYQEHVASQRAWRILVELRALLPAPDPAAPLALGGAAEGDPSLLPPLMAELTLVEVGWRTVNLGPDVPAASYDRAVRAYRPRLVWISVTLHEGRPEFFAAGPQLIEAARAAGAAVMVGGQGLTPALQDRLPAAVFGTRLAHLRAFARDLRR